ncbi:MAG: hypothetical protein HQK76_18615 [Desulfobacterales bacterium]|nr:hypothetical protein [Desulfobacterales bacterium]
MKQDKDKYTIEWHRLFGLILKDFFYGTGYEVELEMDLSIKKQFLDVVIIEKKEGTSLTEVPDGLEDLSRHNLVSFKSHQDTLNSFSIEELIGHYVNYRKQSSPSLDKLLPSDDFRLYAVTPLYPQKLFKDKGDKFQKYKEGVYDLDFNFVKSVRVIVLKEISNEDKNAMWNLFSAVPKSVSYGAEHYHWKSYDVSSIINVLYKKYNMEGINMPYTFQDFRRDYVLMNLDEIPLDDILKRFSPDERLKGLSPDERLKGLSPDDILKRFSPDKRLEGLSKEDLLKKLKDLENK